MCLVCVWSVYVCVYVYVWYVGVCWYVCDVCVLCVWGVGCPSTEHY